MKFTLPKPPSINHIYGFTSKGGFARSYITKEGKEWFENSIIEIQKQTKKKKPISTEMEVSIELHTARRQDIDNIFKPCLDLLMKAEVIEDDSLIYRITGEKFKAKVTEEHVVIEILGYGD